MKFKEVFNKLEEEESQSKGFWDYNKAIRKELDRPRKIVQKIAKNTLKREI